jgi:hypothetical protein
MIQSVLSATLQGFNGQLNPVLDVFHTVFVNRQTATATVALASYSQGLENFQPGWAGAFITKAGVSPIPGQTNNLPLDRNDVNRTQLRIENCAFVTFRMVIAKAEARATATVFVEGTTPLLGMKTKSAYIHDRTSGKIKAVHHVTFPADSRAPSDALVLRRIRDCAAETWSVRPGSLDATLMRKSDPAFTNTLVIDKRTHRIRETVATPNLPSAISPAVTSQLLRASIRAR